jgi:hypothetical protein
MGLGEWTVAKNISKKKPSKKSTKKKTAKKKPSKKSTKKKTAKKKSASIIGSTKKKTAKPSSLSDGKIVFVTKQELTIPSEKLEKAQQLINSLNEKRIARETKIEELKEKYNSNGNEPQRELVGLRKGLEVLIQPPQIRTILYEGLLFGNRKYRLSFPYVIFVKNGWIIKAAMSNKPLTTVDDPVYWLPLPNIFSSLMTCTGGNFPPEFSSYDKNYLDKWVACFWGSKFSLDQVLGWPGNLVRMNYLLSFRQWALKTKKDPNFIFKIKWPKVCTVRDMCYNGTYRLFISPSLWRYVKLGLFYNIF